ncbi:MAG: dehydrogenase [Cyanobium sp.]
MEHPSRPPHPRRLRAGSQASAALVMLGLALGGLSPLSQAARAQAVSNLGATGSAPSPPVVDPLLGPRTPLAKDWQGTRPSGRDTPILVMAGHADAQGIGGSGTSGEAVGLYGAAPMRPGISDEHYWCLHVAHAVAVLGRERGLRIDFHIPPVRTMLTGNEAGSNWTVGRDHAAAGGYALEIHFDAYGSAGVGSGLIPPLHRPFSTIDESLAQEFGGFPMNFRDRLGGPKRGIALLEVGKLEGRLEASLRDPATRERTIRYIAQRIVYAIERGMAAPGVATTAGGRFTPKSTAATGPSAPPPGPEP